MFDSLGTTGDFIAANLKGYGKWVAFNTSAVQPKNSNHCGQFVIAFLLFRLFNLDLDFAEALNIFFSLDLDGNVTKVLDFIN